MKKNEFCEPNVRGKVRADWSQKNGARIFLTGDFCKLTSNILIVEIESSEFIPKNSNYVRELNGRLKAEAARSVSDFPQKDADFTAWAHLDVLPRRKRSALTPIETVAHCRLNTIECSPTKRLPG